MSGHPPFVVLRPSARAELDSLLSPLLLNMAAYCATRHTQPPLPTPCKYSVAKFVLFSCVHALCQSIAFNVTSQTLVCCNICDVIVMGAVRTPAMTAVLAAAINAMLMATISWHFAAAMGLPADLQALQLLADAYNVCLLPCAAGRAMV